MRIAIPIWEDKISPVLDTASKLLIIENVLQREIARFEVNLLEPDISRRCRFIRGLNINILICGGVSRQLSDMLEASGINVISGISGSAEDIIEAYLKERLGDSKFFMPGCNSYTLGNKIT
jgi:predicted Fe-Mo cluster-binding NifX family protein